MAASLHLPLTWTLWLTTLAMAIMAGSDLTKCTRICSAVLVGAWALCTGLFKVQLWQVSNGLSPRSLKVIAVMSAEKSKNQKMTWPLFSINRFFFGWVEFTLGPLFFPYHVQLQYNKCCCKLANCVGVNVEMVRWVSQAYLQYQKSTLSFYF